MKLQAWSTDFAVSLVIFLTAFSLIIFIWHQTFYHTHQNFQIIKMERLALSISDKLIRTPGFPRDWNDTTVEVLGLAEEENILNSTKIEIFLGMENETIRSLLGIQNYNFYFEILYLNNTLVEIDGKTLVKGVPPKNTECVIPVERYVILQNLPVKMRFTLWS